jgi:two-component system chemotaxis response regulator CheB
MVTKQLKKLILIGASTGGPQALAQILSELPTDFVHPIIITQHMPTQFIEGFVRQLSRNCVLKVKKALDGEIIESGTIFVSEGDQNLKIKRVDGELNVSYTGCSLDDGFCPSVNSLFNSAKELKNIDVVAVILTGIGNDGAISLTQLKNNGAEIWAQEEENCIAFGMPKAAIKTGQVDRVLSVSDIGRELGSL